MPTIRYEIRSEYGLADPELYQAADKDDPEALLEGVAMAGLVGVLRQLGDLAEFAAKIFHDLHEEVTATSARGHGLMLRVQQLEAEFPSIEMDLLNQTSHSNYAYNEGIDWHTNLRVDQNLVTQGDMPRFILDSCEECRGPPRLFMLDKFDVAGAGACLKRYSDPSIFRVELASSGLMKEEVQLEMKARKIKKRTSPWKNGEATDSFLATLVTPKLQPQSSDQIPSKVPTRHIKLKCRNLSDPNITSRRSYMKHLLEKHSTEEKVWSENATTHSPLIIDSIDSNELTPEISETVINTITDSNLVREGTLTESPTRKEVAYIPPRELENHHKVKNVEISKSVRRKMVMTGAETANEEVNCVSDKAEFRSAEFTTEGSFGGDIFNGYTTDVAQMTPTVYPDWKLNPEWNLKKALANAEFTQWDLHDHKSDDIGSDLEKYGDALNTMESETETDSDHKIKSDPGFSSTGVHDMTSGIYEQQDEIPPQLSPDSVEESITSNSVISHVLVHPQSLNRKSSLNLPAIPEIYLKSEVEEDAATVNVLPNGTCNGKELETTSIELEIKEASSGSSLLDSAPSHTNTYSEGGDEAQSFIPLPDYSAGTHVVSQELDCQVEPSEFSKNPDTFSLEFSPISEMRDSSIVTKDEGIHPAECIEEESSVNIEGALDISDHLSSMLNESTLADIPTQHIEEPAVVLTANLEGELQGSLKQAADICLDGNSSPTIPELSSEIDPTTVDPEDSADSEQDTEVCLDRSISPTIPDLSSEIDPITVHPEDLVDNEQDADICLDGNTSPTIPELSAEIAPAALHLKDLADSEYTECFGYSSYFPDTLLPLTEIPWKSNFSKDDEPKYSRDMDAMQEENIPEIAVKHVEDSSVSKLQLEVSQVAITQENSTCFGEDTSPSYSSLAPRNSEFITQTDAIARNSEFITQTDAVAIGGGDIVAVGEGSDAEDIKPLGLENLSNSENPQESHEVNQEEVLLSSGKADLPDGTNQHLNFSTEDMVEDNVLLPYIEPLVLGGSADPMEPNESQDAHMLEHIPEDVVLLNEEHLGMTSSDAEEPKESDGVTDVVDFPDGSTEDNLQEEAVHVGKRTECDDSLDEYVIVEADDINYDSSSFYAGKASEFDVQLQEDYLPYGSILSRHDTEVNDASEHKNLTLMPQGEPQPVTSTALSCSELPTELLYGVYCPISSETNIAKGSSLNSSENKDSVPEDIISPLTHSLVMDELISGDDSEPNEVSFSTEGEPDSVSSHQEGEYLEALSTNEENNIESICRNIEDQPSKRGPCFIFSAAEIDEIESPLSNIDIHETEKDEPAIASKSSADIPVATLGSSILSSELPSTQSSGQNITQTSSQETSDLLPGEPSSSFQVEDVDETPPPPPLPPMQWRVGKLHLGSLASSVDAVEPPAASSPFMELIAGDEKCPANPFASFAVVGNERYLEGPLIPKEEVAQPSRLSQLPPIAGDDREKSSVLCVRGVANPSNPGLVESHREDEKSRNGHDVPVTQLYEGEGQSGQYRRPPLSHLLPSLELERSQHEGFSVPRNPILPLNPQLVGPYEEEWKHQYGYGVYGGESRQHLNFPAMGPNMPPYGFVYSLAENSSIVYDYMIPTVDGEKKYRSIRDRPRDPLIEAVAAHDKSTLRKVSELDLPSARPDTVERDSLLEQIRNKALNLKPNAPKPNIKGVPQTNLKVAAILEKANAIRQACVGSVEDDDDGDSWSDS